MLRLHQTLHRKTYKKFRFHFSKGAWIGRNNTWNKYQQFDNVLYTVIYKHFVLVNYHAGACFLFVCLYFFKKLYETNAFNKTEICRDMQKYCTLMFFSLQIWRFRHSTKIFKISWKHVNSKNYSTQLTDNDGVNLSL